MIDRDDLICAQLRRLDAKIDRLRSDVADLRGRVQRVEGRLTGLDARLGVLETFEVARRAQVPNATARAEPLA